MSTLTGLVAAGLLFYLSICLFMYFKQADLIYFPNSPARELSATPAAVGLEYEDIRLTTADGVRLHAWYVPNRQAKYTLLFSHGNAGNISHRLDSIKIFHELGLSVLIYDYRGYGQSEGKLSEAGTYHDVRAGWHYLVNTLHLSPDQIVLFGRSLGGAMASKLATEVKPCGLILESAFASVPDLAAMLYPFLPTRLLARFQYNNVDHIKHNKAPLLVIHSKGDEMIPWQQGRAIYAAAVSPKSWLDIHGGHNDGFMASYDTYTRGLREFLNQHCFK
ncbi:MAG: alpha/beta hydrolase [Gammaproteobacteria bacterium]|nr:alpha/beta hydrolase [Gammaproteobacteria bacterium]MDH5651625.1 alpha/beta hydrolase [Gammaproteobacteria bacterium]